MNSLEFINQEIMYTQKDENIVKIQIESTPNDRELQSQLKVIQECLSYLQQIKSVLEAWEVVKNKLNLKVQTEEAVTEGFCMKGYWLLVEQYPYIQTTILEQEEYDILKKALEVDNSVQWVEHTLKDFKRDNLL